MNLFTLNSAFLPWLLLAIVPLLLHLFARSRPPRYAFSSNALIARLKREAARIKRPRDWLLLLLRTLLFLALVGVFLQPVFFALRNPAGRFEPRHVVIIVDATASMAYADGSQSRFAAACAEASSVLAGLTARDRANVIWLRHPPEAVLPELSGNTAFLRSALRQARVTAGGGHPAAAMALAVAQLAGVEGQREICIISDFQKTGWTDVTPALPPDISLLAIPVANGDGENMAITGVRVEPGRPVAGEDVLIVCEVANYAPLPRRRTVYIEAGDIRRSVALVVPAWGVASASLPCRFLNAEFVPVVATIDEDAFPVDNRRTLALQVDLHVRVGIHDHDASVADAWRRAITALGWAKVEPVSREDLQGTQDWDALLLAGWDGTGVDALARRAAAGTPLTVSPNASLPIAALWQLEGMPPAGIAGNAADAWQPDQPAQPIKVLVKKPAHPLFSLFEAEGLNSPVTSRFQHRLRIPHETLPPGDTLLAFEDAIPALTRSRRLPVYLWNMPLDPVATDWPKHPAFVLFMGELLNLQRQDMHGRTRLPVFPGELLTLTPDRPIMQTETLTLTHELGEAVGLAEQFRAGFLTYVGEKTSQPGIYTWRSGSEILALDAVNVPAEESDLRTGEIPAFDSNTRTVVIRSGAVLKTQREGRPLWPLLLAICMGLALVEGLAAWWTEWT
jgi:hypothetical protein